MVPCLLKLGKLPLPVGLVEPPRTRVRTATVYHHDGRDRPTTYGVTVDKDAKVADIVAAGGWWGGVVAGGCRWLQAAAGGC